VCCLIFDKREKSLTTGVQIFISIQAVSIFSLSKGILYLLFNVIILSLAQHIKSLVNPKRIIQENINLSNRTVILYELIKSMA